MFIIYDHSTQNYWHAVLGWIGARSLATRYAFKPSNYRGGVKNCEIIKL